MKKSVYTSIILLLSYCVVYGQISTEEEPASFRRNIQVLEENVIKDFLTTNKFENEVRESELVFH